MAKNKLSEWFHNSPDAAEVDSFFQGWGKYAALGIVVVLVVFVVIEVFA